MATVLRVRRKRTFEPSEALIFSCKKAKTRAGEPSGKSTSSAAGASAGGAAGDSGDVKTVFKFAGTVAKKDQPISQRIRAARSAIHLYANPEPTNIKTKPKPKTTTTSSKKSKSKSKSKSDSKTKSRTANLSAQQEGRFQIIATQRGLHLGDLDNVNEPSSGEKVTSNGTDRGDKELFSFFDVIMDDEQRKSQAITCNSVQMIREKLVIDEGPDTEYVYDLYYADDNQLDFGQGVVTGMQIEDEELVYDFFDEDNETYDDDDDSNDENNWRNDYPDEDPDKRPTDLFDEYQDDYRYGEMSSDDDDLINDYGDYRKRPMGNLDYIGGRDPLDDLM